MQQHSRKPPAKKRHTKPCKFFQMGRCQLSTEECDFAHVLANEILAQSTNPCRYFTIGRCGNGSRCRYKHVIELREDAPAEVPDPLNARDGAETDLSPNATKSSEGTAPAPIGIRVPLQSMYSPVAWQSPYSNTFQSAMFSPALPTPQQFYHHAEIISPPHSADSSTSTRSSLSDDKAFVTEDPKYSEHIHQYQSQVRVADELPLIHVPPFYDPGSGACVPVLVIDTAYPTLPNKYGTYTFQSPPVSPSSPAKSRVASRYKVTNYKTKPCKYYKDGGMCPKGSDCTFIHDDAEPVEEPLSASPPTASCTKQRPTSLPPKPVSLNEENKKKNFFPISWRVIGGGVLMGEPKPNPTSQDINLKETEEDTEQVQSPAKPITRPRSSSIPPTPSITYVNVETLFSAESPGNL